MNSMHKLTFIVSLWCLLQFAGTDRLIVPSGGYARVIGVQQEPLQAFTLSAWVNVTAFPDGIVPLLTYLNSEATSQIAFFLRQQSIGILWGGPSTESVITDRRPRVYWNKNSKRSRRSAVDYSGGLGNIENILGRTGRDNKWSPVNFIDVAELGVSDLQTSGSGISERSGMPFREARTSSSDPYPGWTNVPYELHMAESGSIDGTAQEPRIITKPEGDDEFVYFNWNHGAVPSPASDNSWTPRWESEKSQEITKDSPIVVRPPPVDSNSPEAEDLWTSQVENVGLRDGWNVNGHALETVVLPSNVERPVWPTNDKTDSQPQETPNKEFSTEMRPPPPPPPSFALNSHRAKKPIQVIPLSEDNTENQSPATGRPHFRYTQSAVLNSKKEPIAQAYVPKRLHNIPTTTTRTTSTTTTTEAPITTTKSPLRVQLEAKTSKKQDRVRTPLWMLIKKPNSDQANKNQPKYPRVPPTTPRRKKPTTPSPKISKPSRPAIPNSDFRRNKTPAPKRSHVRPRPTRPTTPRPRKRLTAAPKINIKPSYTYRSKVHTSKPTNEFEKTMKNPVLVQEGNRAVVYAVPINDEKEFYTMYKKYQKSVHKENSKKTNIHELYKKMRMGTVQEKENNENTLRLQTRPKPVRPKPISSSRQELKPSPIEKFSPSPAPELVLPTETEEDYYYYEYDDNEPQEETEVAEPVSTARPNVILPRPVPGLTEEELYSLSKLYRPVQEVDQEVRPRPSYYQEPAPLSHEQLPPQYGEKPEKDLPTIFQPSTKLETGFIPSKMGPPPPPSPSSSVYNPPSQGFFSEPQSKIPDLNDWVVSNPQISNERAPIAIPLSSGPEAAQSSEINTPQHSFQEKPIQPVVESEDFFAPEETNVREQFQDPIIISDPNNPLGINIKELPYSFHENGWYHIAFTWNGQSHVLGIYVNGEKIGDIPNVLKNSAQLRDGGLYMLGRTLLPDLSDFDESSRFNGEMSDVNLWAKDFSSQEVDAMFQCQYRPTVTQPLIWNQTPMVFYDSARLVSSPPFCGVIT